MSEKLVPLNVLITSKQKAVLEDTAKEDGISVGLVLRRMLFKNLPMEKKYKILGHYKTRGNK